MPNIKSAKKRVDIAARNRKVNVELKSRVRTLIKNCLKAAKAGEEEALKLALSLTFKTIDKGSKGSTYHKNKAARLKSRLVKKTRKYSEAAA
ncbi:MAG: 30S ribosomal protein S20 [Candidatus Caenarcaniphilales bacterium]|nr:30S ribosomal protein S20 [Candidatus Caenarcaniphilales bacterium]